MPPLFTTLRRNRTSIDSRLPMILVLARELVKSSKSRTSPCAPTTLYASPALDSMPPDSRATHDSHTSTELALACISSILPQNLCVPKKLHGLGVLKPLPRK